MKNERVVLGCQIFFTIFNSFGCDNAKPYVAWSGIFKSISGTRGI